MKVTTPSLHGFIAVAESKRPKRHPGDRARRQVSTASLPWPNRSPLPRCNARRGGRGLHGFIAVAESKPGAFAATLGDPLRVSTASLPWPNRSQGSTSSGRQGRQSLHGFIAVAESKRRSGVKPDRSGMTVSTASLPWPNRSAQWAAEMKKAEDESPRLHCRGRIEAQAPVVRRNHGSRARLHGFIAVAESKRLHLRRGRVHGGRSPRLHCRGRIEARRRQWDAEFW